VPYVLIQVTREGTTAGEALTTVGQKAALIKGVTDLLLDVMGKEPESTFVVIEEVELENWGVAGLNVLDYRRAKNAKHSKR